MTKKIKCLVVTPVGPKSNVEHVQDTVNSFLHYMRCDDAVMLLLDDTRNARLNETIKTGDRVRVVPATDREVSSDTRINTYGQLFVKQLRAIESISREYDWQCLMRLDDDALILGHDPHHDALAFFQANASVGILGAYLRRGDGTNKEPAMRKMGRLLLRQIFSPRRVGDLKLRLALLRVALSAKKNGYRLGDMCTGGAFFMTQAAYKGIVCTSRAHLERLSLSPLPDDLLFALHAAAAGFSFSDFCDDPNPMAINWQGLPMPVEELVRRKKKIVHPVKDPTNLQHEYDVRAFFQRLRAEECEKTPQG